MDTIKIIKGVFNNEDIIKDNNAIAAAFSDGTAIGIDTKNDSKFQEDFLSGSGNKDEKEIYISTIDMLTPEADVSVDSSGGKLLRVKGVRCKNVSHSDSDKLIPDNAVSALSNTANYKDLILQMPDSAGWNFNSSGNKKTSVTFSAKGKSGSVKSTTKQGKFVVTQPIIVQFYKEAAGQLTAGSTVYTKGSSVFEETTLLQNQNFQSGKKIKPCTEVTRATQKVINVDDSGNLSPAINSTDKWLKISCDTHSCLVVKYGSDTFEGTCSGNVKKTYETTCSEILADALVKIGIYKQNLKTDTATISDFNAQNSKASNYGNWNYSYSYNGSTYSGVLTDDGGVPNGGNYKVTLTVSKTTYESTYNKVNEYSYEPDKNLFYAGIYCNEGWYDADGLATIDSPGKIYSEQPTAGDGNKFDGTEIFYVKGEKEIADADDDLCTVDSTGNVLLKTSVNLTKKVTYLIGVSPSYSVSFD